MPALIHRSDQEPWVLLTESYSGYYRRVFRLGRASADVNIEPPERCVRDADRAIYDPVSIAIFNGWLRRVSSG
jgi:hypothetical protein